MTLSKEKLAEDWVLLRVADIASKYGTSEQSIYYWARKYGLPSRLELAENSVEMGPDDPSEDEIRSRSAAIRESWTPEERARRTVACGVPSCSQGIRCYSTAELFGVSEAVAYSRI